jgi:hypothetical protein
VNCATCNAPIPPDRAEFLLETKRPYLCQSCSGEQPRLTLMDYAHKTAPSLVVVPRGQESLALRAFKRSR